MGYHPENNTLPQVYRKVKVCFIIKSFFPNSKENISKKLGKFTKRKFNSNRNLSLSIILLCVLVYSMNLVLYQLIYLNRISNSWLFSLQHIHSLWLYWICTMNFFFSDKVYPNYFVNQTSLFTFTFICLDIVV